MNSRDWKLPFFTIWTGQALSLLGSRLVRFALIWWLTEATGSAATLAAATTASILPTIFLGPFAGALADRWPRKWVLIISDSAIALFTALLSILFWLDMAQPWHILLILFLRSAGDAFQNPAMFSVTPLMVPKGQLTRVSSMNSTLQGMLDFLAPPLGALLLSLVNVRGILPFDVVTAVLAVLPLFFIAIPQTAPKASAAGPRGVLQDLAAGMRYVWEWKGLRYMLGITVLVAFISQPPSAFLPLLIREHFGGGAKEYGWIISFFGMGQIVGGLVLGAWGGYRRNMTTCATGSFGIGLFFLVTALAPSTAFWMALAGYFGLGVVLPIYRGGLRATQQVVVETGMLGRVFSLDQSIRQGMGPLALAAAAPVADAVGVRPFWFIAAGVTLVVFLLRRFTREIYYIEGDLTEPAAEPADA